MLCVPRYAQRKCTALAHRAYYRHLTTVHLGDVLDDRESQARPTALATAGLVDAIKTLKDTIKMVVGNADTLITDVDAEHGGFLAYVHPDAAVRIAVGNGIIEEIDERLFKEGSVDRSA